MSLLVMTWLWRQAPDKGGYFKDDGGADKVNVWAHSLRRNCTLDIELACVTDEPDGIDESVRIIPLPTLFEDVSVKQWQERSGAPQCYRRLLLFHPDAAEYFGAERFVSMDLDCVITGNVDRLFDHDCPFVIYHGTSGKRPYNGSMMQMDAGARAHVWHTFAKNPQRVAEQARRRYIGSDQAVISYILGPGEERWGVDDGVEAYSGSLIRRYGAGHPKRIRLPDDVRLVFFPGHIKPWELLDRVGFVNEHWHTGTPRGTAVSPGPAGQVRQMTRMPLYAYDDRKKWGRSFKEAADAVAGLHTRLFVRDSRVPKGARAFVRLDQQAAQRDVSRRMVDRLYRRGVTTLPTYREMLWYDDKVAQLPDLAPWMPETRVVTDENEAHDLAVAIGRGRVPGLTFPLVSKAKEGSSSATVRMLVDNRAAHEEIARAFGAGIVQRYNRVQKGYVYWQRFVPENPRDYRVCITGPYLYGIVRNNRPDSFMASGSGDSYALTLGSDPREREAARFCVEIARALDTRWMAFDVVFDPDAGGAPRVLEMSSAWTMSLYVNSPMFDFDLNGVNLTGADSFTVAVDVLRTLPDILSGDEPCEAQPAVVDQR